MEHSEQLAALSQKLDQSEESLAKIAKGNITINKKLQDAEAEKARLKADQEKLKALTVKKLKDRLRELSLPVSGNKAELVERLLEASEFLTWKLHKADIQNAQLKAAESEEKLKTAKAEDEARQLKNALMNAHAEQAWLRADTEENMRDAQAAHAKEKEVLQAVVAEHAQLGAELEDLLTAVEVEKDHLKADREALVEELNKEKKFVEKMREDLAVKEAVIALLISNKPAADAAGKRNPLEKEWYPYATKYQGHLPSKTGVRARSSGSTQKENTRSVK